MCIDSNRQQHGAAVYFLLRLQVVVDADPGAIARILERFQNLNITPRRVNAEVKMNDLLHISVDVGGLSEQQMAFITGKIQQVPSVINAHWSKIEAAFADRKDLTGEAH